MGDNLNVWNVVYNAFEPFEPVAPDKLDAWFVERPYGPLQALLAELDPAKTPRRIVLVGHSASGKSTELTKLAADLNKQYDYFVVRINLDQNLDIERVNPVEVVFLMGAAVFKVAEAQLDRKPDASLFKRLGAGLETLVRTHTTNDKYNLDLADVLKNLICFGAAALGGPLGAAAANVFTQAIHPLSFVSGTDAQVVRKLEVEPKVEEMVEALNAIIDDVQVKAGKPLVLLVDGLDRPHDEEIIALNFVEKNYLVKPACRIIYTAPMWVYYLVRFAPVRARFRVMEFPNIKLYERETGKRDNKGYATMREVVNKRLVSLGLKPEEVIAKSALDLLIHASGGVMRDLIRLMQHAALAAQLGSASKITKAIAEKPVVALRRQYEAPLRPRHRQALTHVRQSHQVSDDAICNELLQGNFILSYINDEVWYDVHSLLQPFVEEE